MVPHIPNVNFSYYFQPFQEYFFYVIEFWIKFMHFTILILVNISNINLDI